MVSSRRRVWLKKRKNPKRYNGDRTVSYTLQWKDEDGKERFQSLGKSISREDAERKRARRSLNSIPHRSSCGLRRLLPHNCQSCGKTSSIPGRGTANSTFRYGWSCRN